MIDVATLADIELLRETVDLECKLALGRDGKGAVPEDFWRTYSAFANTEGGVVLFGVREKNRAFMLEGIPEPERLRRELFDAANNLQKVSVNLLSDAKVREVEIEGRTILAIEIRRASRHERPVYLKGNPLGGNTYRRLDQGDCALTDIQVKRMLAEQVEDSRDDRMLPGFSLRDIDMDTFGDYRQVFSTREPNHTWNTYDDYEFLRNLGGWRRDRETGSGGLTVAGLLMFGRTAAIQEEFPNYMLDYQERLEPAAVRRWVDRLTLDGNWSGNLYDFYRKVYRKLTENLKVPFRLVDGQRKDESLVHDALREALANVLVHADYSDRASVLIVKRPDMFGFRNPGRMRISVEAALKGGESDCRNRMLHKMFRMVGAGEQAGSGIPKILHGWRSQQWSPPKLRDTSEPYDQTLLELRMLGLFPEQTRNSLEKRFGTAFQQLSDAERMALALAESEGTVNHARLREVTTEHSVDLSKTLQHLTHLGMLESTRGRGAVYHLPGRPIPTPEDVFGLSAGVTESSSPNLESSSPNLESSSPNLETSSPNLEASIPVLETASLNFGDNRDQHGCLLSEQLALPMIDDLASLTHTFRSELEAIADKPRKMRKLDRDVLVDVILALCTHRFVSIRSLAELVRRKPETLREQYLRRLVQEKKLHLAFPKTPTHERQAYTTSDMHSHS